MTRQVVRILSGIDYSINFANLSQAPDSEADLAALKARIGPLSVTNGHMPLAAFEVAQLRPTATWRSVLVALVELGASLGFIGSVLFLISKLAS